MKGTGFLSVSPRAGGQHRLSGGTGACALGSGEQAPGLRWGVRLRGELTPGPGDLAGDRAGAPGPAWAQGPPLGGGLIPTPAGCTTSSFPGQLQGSSQVRAPDQQPAGISGLNPCLSSGPSPSTAPSRMGLGLGAATAGELAPPAPACSQACPPEHP